MIFRFKLTIGRDRQRAFIRVFKKYIYNDQLFVVIFGNKNVDIKFSAHEAPL